VIAKCIFFSDLYKKTMLFFCSFLSGCPKNSVKNISMFFVLLFRNFKKSAQSHQKRKGGFLEHLTNQRYLNFFTCQLRICFYTPTPLTVMLKNGTKMFYFFFLLYNFVSFLSQIFGIQYDRGRLFKNLKTIEEVMINSNYNAP
jgi:hypothetical protein